MSLDFNLYFFNNRLSKLLYGDRLVDDNGLLHYNLRWLLNHYRFFRSFHHNWLRNEWKDRIGNFRLDSVGLGLNLTDFDVELEFAVG